MVKYIASTVMLSNLDTAKNPITKVGWMSKLSWVKKEKEALALDATERYFFLNKLLTHQKLLRLCSHIPYIHTPQVLEKKICGKH